MQRRRRSWYFELPRSESRQTIKTITMLRKPGSTQWKTMGPASKCNQRIISKKVLGAASCLAGLIFVSSIMLGREPLGSVGGSVTVRRAIKFDVSPPLASEHDPGTPLDPPACQTAACAAPTSDPDGERDSKSDPALVPPPIPPAGAAVEQTLQGANAPVPLTARF